MVFKDGISELGLFDVHIGETFCRKEKKKERKIVAKRIVAKSQNWDEEDKNCSKSKLRISPSTKFPSPVCFTFKLCT